ncbi:hypothetical protein ILYODFUR_026894 [Ilyodon furcidens]|uniref:Uncharacterized protein n=1 Tax=Ilyodon furcidens TaxID=33524 RepID=A0ABV0VIF3_9TELE
MLLCLGRCLVSAPSKGVRFEKYTTNSCPVNRAVDLHSSSRVTIGLYQFRWTAMCMFAVVPYFFHFQIKDSAVLYGVFKAWNIFHNLTPTLHFIPDLSAVFLGPHNAVCLLMFLKKKTLSFWCLGIVWVCLIWF